MAGKIQSAEGVKVRVEIEIDTGNAAFEDNPNELYSVLMDAAKKGYRLLESSIVVGIMVEDSVRETNGNTCGRVRVIRKRR